MVGPNLLPLLPRVFSKPAWGAQLRVFPAHLPLSNGRAEVAVKATKRFAYDECKSEWRPG